MEIIIERYRAEYDQQWNNFISTSDNGCFFFNRSFLSYHGDRFEDHSLLFYNQKNSLLAVLPAAIIDGRLASHPGLTFGGMVYKKKIRTELIEKLLASLIEYCEQNNINTLTYRPVPSFYSNYSNSVDQYFFVKRSAVLKKVQLSFLIGLNHPLNLRSNRKQSIKKLDASLAVGLSENVDIFYKLLSRELKAKYNTKPLHTLSDLEYLMKYFPENIKIMTAHLADEFVGGILIFCFKDVIKTQYIISNELGFKQEAISQIIINLHERYSNKKSILDLGSAYLENGNLNTNLVQFKESLGAFPAPVYTYELSL